MPTQHGRRTSVVARQRAAVERLKSSLFGTDPYVHSRYINDFHREFRSFKARLSHQQLLEICAKPDILFLGDYHALPSCQMFAAGLLRHLARGSRRVVLFIEMVFARHQRALDRYLAGEIDEVELRRLIHYDRDWGYPWEGYRALLSAAREAGIAVVAADAPPRSGLRLIRRRDRHAAVKIRERLQAEPQGRALVVFGESHMASGHLPREVNEELERHGMERRSIVIVQNTEEIYWACARAGQEGTEAVMVDSQRYCVFNASPLAKYEAYRQTLLRWAQQEDEAPDFGPSVHHLIDLLVGYLGFDRYRTTAPAPDGSVAPLIDLYPEVVTRRDRRKRLDPRPRRRRPRAGMVYRPPANRIDVYAFSLAAGGDAAARFLLAAMRGRAGAGEVRSLRRSLPSPGEGSRHVRAAASRAEGTLPFATTILDEAFVAFSVNYLDHGIPPPVRALTPRSRTGRESGSAGSFAGTYRSLLQAAAGPPKGRGSVRISRARAERTARFGERLGEALYARLKSRADGRDIQRWLREIVRLTGDRAGDGAARVQRLLREAAVQIGRARPQKTKSGPR